jgi:hypothetical protein
VLADPSLAIAFFNRKACSLILFEIGFCKDLGCHTNIDEKIEKYNPLSPYYVENGDESSSSTSPLAMPARPSTTPRPKLLPL